MPKLFNMRPFYENFFVTKKLLLVIIQGPKHTENLCVKK